MFTRIDSKRNRKHEEYPNYYRNVISDLKLSHEGSKPGLDGIYRCVLPNTQG